MRQFMGLESGVSAVFQVQHDHGVGSFAPAAAPQKGPYAAERQAADERKAQQYTNQNKGVNHQVANIVAACVDTLVKGDIRLVADQRQQLLGRVGVGRRQDDGHHRAAALNHSSGNLLELGGLLPGDLVGRIAEDGQFQVAAGGVEGADLRLGGEMESRSGGGNPRVELL